MEKKIFLLGNNVAWECTQHDTHKECVQSKTMKLKLAINGKCDHKPEDWTDHIIYLKEKKKDEERKMCDDRLAPQKYTNLENRLQFQMSMTKLAGNFKDKSWHYSITTPSHTQRLMAIFSSRA